MEAAGFQCPRCRHQNGPRAKFCEECAAPLKGLACAACGAALSPTAKFCSECAHPVEQAAVRARGCSLSNGAPAEAARRRRAAPAHREVEAPLDRVEGDLLLAQTPPDESGAEACFLRAIEVARAQQGKLFELQAAMSLSRPWQRQGQRAEARQLLGETYSWFTEGFDTPDLAEAKAPLDEPT